MPINFSSVIFITRICLIFSIASAGRELQPNTNKICSHQNATNCWPKDLKGNISIGNKEEKTTLGIVGLLTGQTDFSILNTSFDNKETGIDILKSALISNEDKENKTKVGAKKEYVTERSLSPKRVSSYDKMGAEEPHLNLPTPILNRVETSLINHFSPIDILKATASSLPAKVNASQEYSENSNIAKNVSENVTEDLKVSNKTDTNNSTDQTASTEISLSEIKNLPRDGDEETSLGQKIQFQRSSKGLEEGRSNTAGKEILRNTTGICGYLLGKRISFAEPTTLMEFPWTALLLYNTNIRYHCGGSLITTRYVLTAAHCVAQEFYELTGVRLGEYDISEPIDCAPDVVGSKICATTIDVEVVKIVVHHDYSHLSFKNDIALLRLDKEYLGRSFYPICLPAPESIYGDTRATVAGWGATEKAIRSTVLLKANVPIFDISKCREIYRYKVFNDSTEICASGANEVDVCKGDSGGAIFYNQNVRGREKFFQLGIISLGVRGCGDKRFLPAIFTKLSGFYKWIENNLEY